MGHDEVAVTGTREERWSARLAVIGLLVLALGVRTFGAVGFGNGFSLISWCGETSVRQIEPILVSGNPLHFEQLYYPPVPAMVTAGTIALWRLLGGGGGIAAQCWVVSLLVSLATVAVVYGLGRFWGRRHGLIAAAFYAVAMIAAVILNNGPQLFSTFFLTLALYAVLLAETDGTTRSLTLAGVWLGLGVASKYLPIFFAGVLFLPYVLRRWDSRSPPAPAGGESRDGGSQRLLERAWAGGLWALVALGLAAIWVGVVERDAVYGALRRLYAQRPHENPFEYHLRWIDRLYWAGVAGLVLTWAMCGLALLIPSVQRKSPWQWARSLSRRYHLWVVPCLALAATLVVALAVPIALNFQTFARDFVYIATGRESGDNGIFPGHSPAVSYLFGYIPENTGVLLFAAGLVGLVYPFVRRDRRAALLIAGAVPAWVVLELNRVKVNGYVLELLPLWCLLAALWLGDLCGQRRPAWRWAGRALVAVVVVGSLVYSLAWIQFFRGTSLQTEAGQWLTATVPPGTSLGVKSRLVVNGSPQLLPDARFLAPYRLLDYREEPEYVLLPNLVYEVMVQYLEGVRKGYVYTERDWHTSAPTAEDLRVLSRIVRKEGYVLVREFRKQPEFLGLAVGSHSLSGRTWFVEHSGAVGLRVYRRAGSRA